MHIVSDGTLITGQNPASSAPAAERLLQVLSAPVLQGEGDLEAARRHRASLETFVESGQVEDAAHDAEPKTPVEEVELFEAERIGESHSKGKVPASKHSPPRPPLAGLQSPTGADVGQRTDCA